MKIELMSRKGVLLLGAALLASTAIACGSNNAAPPAAPPAKATPAAQVLKPNADRVVNVEWLSGKIADANVVSIDLRTKDKYEAGHIPGAVWISTADFNVKTGDIGDLAPASQIAAALGKVGITPANTIVLYDDQGSLWSTRILWSLDVYGHKDSRVLNGTWTVWEAAKKPITKEVKARPATQYVFAAQPNT